MTGQEFHERININSNIGIKQGISKLLPCSFLKEKLKFYFLSLGLFYSSSEAILHSVSWNISPYFFERFVFLDV